jgi:DNA-binding MarR family transcriptional regulator
LALWVLQRDARFYQAQAAKGVDYTASAVADELDRLIQLGMLQSYFSESSNRRRYYEKLQSPLWAVIEAAHGALGRQSLDQES